jgi:hypothetical protein
MNTTTTPTKISTIDINALSWFDKVNGNSYFAGTVTVNYGTPEAQTFKMPFQYGYGSLYEQEARALLFNAGLIPTTSEYELKQNGVIIRSRIQKNCKKSELKNI